jgi:hypothetical protein
MGFEIGRHRGVGLALCLGLALLAGLTLLAGVARAELKLIPGSVKAIASNSADPLNPHNANPADPATQAGAHPYMFTTQFAFETSFDPVRGENAPGGSARDIEVKLPVGFTGNPRAVTQCSQVDLVQFNCPTDSRVGYGEITTGSEPGGTAIYNMQTSAGEPARLGFMVAYVVPVAVSITVDDQDDYSLRVLTRNTSQGLGLDKVVLTLWGVPADPSHDADREGESTLEPRPFLSLPTSCGAPLDSVFTINSWQQPGTYLGDTSISNDGAEPPNPVAMSGCDQVDFKPSLQARPSTNVADSPAGLDVSLHVPQSEDPDGLATANLRDLSMDLPAGLSVNPSSANGLGACTPGEIGLTTPVGQAPARFNSAPAACPNSSKLGTVAIETPAVDHPLPGTMHLASQGENPFGSLLATYLVIDDPESGIGIKLAGKIEANAQTGQLGVSFMGNPQLPFEDLRVSLFDGPRAALKTPLTCGSFTTSSVLTPWTAPEGASVTWRDSFQVDRGANGGACLRADAEAPNRPTMVAGTADPTAAAYSPFVLKLARADGTQPITGINATLPPGLLGKLAGTSYCADASLAAAAGKPGRSELASPSCPASSQVGSVTVGAGAGSNPVHVGGKAYLAGPYKGAPLSLAIVTPAVAGPFDLGTVVVRNALHVDPETARIQAVSDPIPTILQGIPLDLRSIQLNMDRPGFTLNPTSCAPMSVLVGATSVFGQIAALSNPFQVGGCGALGFKPKLSIALKGGTKRSQYPALRATLKARPGDANISKAVVSLPKSEFLAQNHIKTVCTRVQFAANACPAGSIYGKARAWSPLLDQPLSGPVYLRSSSNKLPDLVADLNGQIRVALVGRIDSVKGGIRTSFESVPDAPVSKFVLEMAGGKKGLLENSRNLCKTVNKANVLIEGQNGKTADQSPVLKSKCKKKKPKKHGK